jgi:hypothetical protein
VAQGFLPEHFDRAQGLGAGLAGDLLVGLEMDEVLANLLDGDEFGRATEKLAQMPDTGQVSLDSARADRQERQVIGEGIKDGVRGTFLICMGLQC